MCQPSGADATWVGILNRHRKEVEVAVGSRKERFDPKNPNHDII